MFVLFVELKCSSSEVARYKLRYSYLDVSILSKRNFVQLHLSRNGAVSL